MNTGAAVGGGQDRSPVTEEERNQGPERTSSSVRVTRVPRGRAGIQTQALAPDSALLINPKHCALWPLQCFWKDTHKSLSVKRMDIAVLCSEDVRTPREEINIKGPRPFVTTSKLILGAAFSSLCFSMPSLCK